MEMITSYKLRTANSLFTPITLAELTKGLELSFSGYDTGKLIVFYVEENKVIIRESGKRGWYSIGETRYYSPKYIIGIVQNDIFSVYKELAYTKETMKQAKETALNLVQGSGMNHLLK